MAHRKYRQQDVRTHNLRNVKRVYYGPVEYRKRPVEIRKRLKVDVTAMMYQRLSNGGLREMRKITYSNMFEPDDPRLFTKAGAEEFAQRQGPGGVASVCSRGPTLVLQGNFVFRK